MSKTAKEIDPVAKLDGNPEVQTEAFPASRTDNFYEGAERVQSGGLADDPTVSGAPVKNRYPFANLKGGR